MCQCFIFLHIWGTSNFVDNEMSTMQKKWNACRGFVLCAVYVTCTGGFSGVSMYACIHVHICMHILEYIQMLHFWKM